MFILSSYRSKNWLKSFIFFYYKVKKKIQSDWKGKYYKPNNFYKKKLALYLEYCFIKTKRLQPLNQSLIGWHLLNNNNQGELW
jgi:hypothetical protein